MTRPLRWGFLGASRIGRMIAPAVLRQPGHEIVAIASRDGDRARTYAAEIGAKAGVEGYAALLADPSIDVAYVGLTNDEHFPWTLAALQAGKHVLCEKPLTLSAAQVRQLAEAERATGYRVMEAFCHPFHPRMDRIRAMLAQGELGRLTAFQACFLKPCPPGDFRWTAALGGGSLYDRGGYCVYLARLLLGREPLSAFAVAERIDGIDSTMTGVLDFGDGLAASIRSSMTAADFQDLTLSGTKGTIYLDLPISNINRETHLRVNADVTFYPTHNAYETMVDHFVGALAGRWPMRCGLDDALHQAQAMDALLESAASGRPVTVQGAA